MRRFGVTLTWLAATLARAGAEMTFTDGGSLGLKIIGTIIQSDASQSVALVKESKSGRVLAVRPGLSTTDGYQIEEVAAKYILVARSGQRWTVYQDKFAREFQGRGTTPESSGPPALATTFPDTPGESYQEAGFERKQNAVTMSSDYRDRLISQDLAKILMQATAEPYLVGNQIRGFRLSQIDAGSIYWKSGLRDDDIITSINGKKLTSVGTAITVLKSAQKAESVEFELIRQGKVERFSINVR